MDSRTTKKLISGLKDEIDVKAMLKSRFFKKDFSDEDLSILVNLAEFYDDMRYLTYKYIESALSTMYEHQRNFEAIHNFVDFIVNVSPKEQDKPPKMLLKSSPIYQAVSEAKKTVSSKKATKLQKSNSLTQYEQLLNKMEEEARVNNDIKKAKTVSKLLSQIGGEYEKEFMMLQEAAKEEYSLDSRKSKATHQKLSIYCDPAAIDSLISNIFQYLFNIDNETPLNEATKKIILENLNSIKLNYSELLIGFCAANMKLGGIVSIYCLEIIFKLVVEKSMEYPNFYPSFYSILNVDLFRTVHRVRLFELMNLFLMTSHIPKNYVAAFVKKLARIAILSETPVRLFLAPFTVSLLLRYPETQYLIQRPDLSVESFDFEADINNCKVDQTCLWELATLANDKNPTIRSMMKKLENGEAIKSEFNLSGLIQNSFTILIKKEFKKAVVDPALNHCRPESLFSVNSSKYDAGNLDILGDTERIVKGSSRKNEMLSELAAQTDESMSNQVIDIIADRLVMNSYFVELDSNWK